MEFEQIIKRLDWLDAEQRKTKAAISAVEDRITSFETSVASVQQQIKGLEKEFSEFASTAARINQFNELLAKQRDDFTRLLEESEKKHKERQSELVRRHSDEVRPFRTEIDELKKSIDLGPIQRELKARATDILRLRDEIGKLQPQIDEARRLQEEFKSSQLILNENRRQDTKRVGDLQGELAAVKKRTDESRAKADLLGDSLRNVENRFHELVALEQDRKAAQNAFIEQMSIAQRDRDRSIQEWREKYEEFKQQGQTLDAQVSALDDMLRNAKKAQETYADLNVKLERRINEVSEMQRLAEDRIRQEWVTFKADDQKRWTGYSLAQEEGLRDLRKDIERLDGRLVTLDDGTQVIQDQMHQTTEATEQQLQELMNVAHQWLTAYERIMGHAKKTTKKASR